MRSKCQILGANIGQNESSVTKLCNKYHCGKATYGPFRWLVRLVILLTNSHCMDQQENETE